MRKLKLFLTLLMLMCIGVTQMWAETAEFSYSDLSGQGTSGSGSAFTGATKGDITMGGVGNGNSSYTQIYANGTLTFTPANGATITKIVLEATTSGYVKTWSSSPDGASVSDKYVTWEGSSTSVVTLTNTASGQARIKNMTVTYTAGTPADPYTVSFSTGAGNGTVNALTEDPAGAGITLPAGPTSIACEGWSFAGWAEAAVASETTTAPTLLAVGANYKPVEDCTLYAVYSRTESGSGGGVEDKSKTEGFETKTTSTTYNGTVTINTNESDCGIGWSIYYGTVSTNDKIAGSNSAQMRWYSSAKTNIPYAKTTTAISGLQSVNFKARVSSTDVKVSLWYSTDGENWTISDVNQETFAAASTAYDFSATINGEVGTGYYVKIGEDGGTAPSSSSVKLIIDAVTFNYQEGSGSSSTTYYLSTPTCSTPTCEKLGTPTVTVPAANLTYNSAKLTWEAVTNAVKYVVKFAGTDHETTDLFYDATGLDAATNYSYQVKAVAAANQDAYCDGDFSASANFTTLAAPALAVDPASKDFGTVATDASVSQVFSVSGSNLQAGTLSISVPSGYSVSPSSISVTEATLAATEVTVSKNTTTAAEYNGNMTISGCGLASAVEVALSMTVAEKYTVKFNTGAGNPTQADITEENPGAGITLPAGPTPKCSADGWVFAGWAKVAVNEETTTAPTLLSGTYNPETNNEMLYAVYSKSEGGSTPGTLDYTITFDDNSTDASSEISESDFVNYITNNADKVSSVSDIVKCYKGATGLKISSKKNNGSLVLTLAESAAISKVVLNTKKKSTTQGASFDVTVGSTAFSTSSELSKDNFVDVEFTGTKTTSNSLSIASLSSTSEGSDSDGRVAWLKSITIYYEEAVTYNYISAPTCCDKHAISIADNIENGSVSADLASACEGATVTLTVTPATNYHLKTLSVMNGETPVAVTENTFSMPAAAVTVSAEFEEDECTPLATPEVTVSGKAYPYDAVKLAWTGIDHANKYKVYIYDNEDNELEHNDEFAGVEYTIGQTLSAGTTYKYSVQAISNTPAVHCPSEIATSSFVTDALPTAHLTLVYPSGTHASSGDYTILTPFNLPSTAAVAGCPKVFVGWDADENCATAPTYAAGAEFTFANTTDVTLYAVYAKAGAASNLFSWAGGGKSDLLALEGVTASSLSDDYAASHSPYLVKFNGDGKYVTITVASQPGKVTFGVKKIGGAGTCAMKVQEADAANGEFTDVEELEIAGASNDILGLETTQAFKSSTRAVKLYFAKGSGDNVGLGPISIEGVVSYSDYSIACEACKEVSFEKAGEDASNTFALKVGDDVVESVQTCEAASVTIEPTVATGYEASFAISGIEGASISENVISIPADRTGTLTVTATFSQINYSVTMAQEGGANAELSADQSNKHYGETINISTSVPTGYVFTGWTPAELFADAEAAAAASTSFTMPNNDVTVTAHFSKKYTVSFNVAGSTTAVAAMTEESVGAGITLPSAPAPSEDCVAAGWVFAGWATAAVASETTEAQTLLTGEYHPTADITLYAVYKRAEGAIFDATTGGDFYIYAEISGTKYYATAFAKKLGSTTDINSAVAFRFEKIVEDEVTYFAIKSGEAYLSYGTSGTDFTFTGTDPYKWQPTTGSEGTWRMKATTGSNRSIVYRAGSTNAFAPYSFNNVDGSEYFDIEIGGGSISHYWSAPECETPAADATLKLMENGNEVTFAGNHKVGDVVTLPNALSDDEHDCEGKVLKGWSTVEITTPVADKPSENFYELGDSYTIASEADVLYAVFAEELPGATTTTNVRYAGSTTGNMDGSNQAALLVDATDVTGWSVVGAKGGASNNVGLNKAGDIRLYYHANGGNTLTITAPQTITSVGLTFTDADYSNAYVEVGGEAVALTDGVYPINATSFVIGNANTSNVQVRIKKIEVNFTAAGSVANYATSCVAPLANPTFSLAEQEEAFTTAQTITLSAEEGTIYYTLDGKTPTSASTEYTAPIVLNDCGTTTIKAIAISATNHSEVVSATYTLNIPLPTISEANPYTPAQAIEVFDGNCYNNEMVYVKGVVKTSSGLNTTYGNYDNIVVVAAETTAPEFTFYHMYKGANNEHFDANDPVIAAGDTIVAYGELTKYNAIYEFKDGCYLIDRKAYNVPKQSIVNDLAGAYTLAEAINFLDNAAIYDLSEEVYVKGVATTAPNSYNTFTAHDPEAENVFQFYNTNLNELTVGVNDTIIVKGLIKKVNANYRMEAGVVQQVTAYVAPVVPEFTVDPTAVAFGNVEQNAQVDAIELNVELTAIANATVTLADENGVFSIDKTDLTKTGVVTVSVVSTATVGNYAATITLHDVAEAAEDVVVNVTMNVTEVETRNIANGSAFTAISGDLDPADIKFAAFKGDGTTNPVINNSNIRLYKPDANNNKTTGGYLKLTALMGCTIDQVEITFNGQATASYAVNDAAFSTDAYITNQTLLLTPTGLDATSVSIVNLKNGSIDISAIKVYYNGSPLAVHHYILGGTYETTFEQNTEFSYEGLTVTAAYDEQETITEAVTGFTVEADLSTAGAKKAEVMLNSVKIAEYDITVNPGKANPNLTYTPESETIPAAEVGTWVAPTLNNTLHVAPITYSSSKQAVATVDENGVIALAGGYGTAVITASFAGDDDNIASEATYTITVQEPVNKIAGKWMVAGAEDIKPGVKVIVVGEKSGTKYAMGTQNTNNRAAVAAQSIVVDTLYAAEGTKTFTLVDAGNGLYAFLANNGKYLYAASGSSNHLKEQATINGNATWSIAIANDGEATIQAQGTNSRNLMSMTPNGNNNPLFSCYKDEQSAIKLYVNRNQIDGSDDPANPAEVAINDNVVEDEIVANGNVVVTVNTDNIEEPKSYIAQNGATIIITGTNPVAKNVVVEDGSRIEASVPTTTPNVYFATTMGSTQTPGTASELGSVTNITLATGGEIIYDLTLGTSMAGIQADPNQWHAFTLPFAVSATEGIYDAETGAKLYNEVNYAIMDYHGDIRANGLYGWKKYSGILQPGVFYIMTVDGNTKTFRFKATQTGPMTQTTSMGYKAYNGSGDPSKDFGWNGIGNPSWVSGTVTVNVQVLDPYSYTYQPLTSSTNITVSTPFFYNAGGDGSTGSVVMQDAGTGANYAPARTPANEIKNVAVSFGNEVFRDKIYISASEDALNEYEQDKDLVRMIMSNTPKVAQIFGNAYGMKLSMVNAPMANDQAEYSLTLYAPNAGEYTISAPEMEDADIFLTYEGSIIWNLSMSEYTNNFAKGNNEGYGLILVKKAPQVITGVDNAEANEAGVQKVIINDHVYILRAEQMYDVTGKMVK